MSESFKTTVDPLLKDLDEKKESFRRNVVSMTAEIKQVRGRLVSQEQYFVKESIFRKEAETKAKNMEVEICKLQKKLEDRNFLILFFLRKQFLEEVDDLRSQLASTKETAETSAASAQSTQLQCSVISQQLDDKTRSLREHQDRVTQLANQLDNLQRDLRTRECSQKELSDEVIRIERKDMECELRKILEEVSPKSIERMNRLLSVKDEEIAKLKDEVRLMSAHWKLKTKGLETQLEKQRRTDQELKKKVVKLEFCLQEAGSQTRKLQRMGEKRDKAIKELRDQITGKQWNESVPREKPNFWDTSGFKIVVSMSMLLLVIVSKK
ncbi:hypothetical protein Bca52824_061105 [Brassica carinata]|uniref:Uncharacterized protein n=1 Tax=Brassica carinata TaxID=52824 RepID=A0A8X7UG78_BRACI|nr:hypothetical protein Bca52824_061105 [Brassica carinata]